MTSMPSDGPDGLVQVLRPATGAIEWVSVPEAARAMITYAAQKYGQDSPAYAGVVMRAVELLAGHGFTPGGQRIGGAA